MITQVHDPWERVFHEIGEQDIPTWMREHDHVDACRTLVVKGVLAFPQRGNG